jgi:hypothetical protein
MLTDPSSIIFSVIVFVCRFVEGSLYNNCDSMCSSEFCSLWKLDGDEVPNECFYRRLDRRYDPRRLYSISAQMTLPVDHCFLLDNPLSARSQNFSQNIQKYLLLASSIPALQKGTTSTRVGTYRCLKFWLFLKKCSGIERLSVAGFRKWDFLIIRSMHVCMYACMHVLQASLVCLRVVPY